METGLRVIRPEDRVEDVASGAMRRQAAVSEELVGARRLWVGYVELDGGMVSGVHHHGEAESVIYVISGEARFLSGDGLDQAQDAGPGDFVWVPPHLVHVELNLSPTEPVRMVVARSTQETLVFNVPAPGGWSADRLRRPPQSTGSPPRAAGQPGRRGTGSGASRRSERGGPPPS